MNDAQSRSLVDAVEEIRDLLRERLPDPSALDEGYADEPAPAGRMRWPAPDDDCGGPSHDEESLGDEIASLRAALAEAREEIDHVNRCATKDAEERIAAQQALASAQEMRKQECSRLMAERNEFKRMLANTQHNAAQDLDGYRARAKAAESRAAGLREALEAIDKGTWSVKYPRRPEYAVGDFAHKALIADAALAAAPDESKGILGPFCYWTENLDGAWDTDCGLTWDFAADGPSENRVTFCHGCGKRVSVLEPPEEAPGE